MSVSNCPSVLVIPASIPIDPSSARWADEKEEERRRMQLCQTEFTEIWLNRALVWPNFVWLHQGEEAEGGERGQTGKAGKGAEKFKI